MYIYRYIHGPHSPVDGQLDLPRVLAFVNSAAMDAGVHASFWIMFTSAQFLFKLSGTCRFTCLYF